MKLPEESKDLDSQGLFFRITHTSINLQQVKRDLLMRQGIRIRPGQSGMWTLRYRWFSRTQNTNPETAAHFNKTSAFFFGSSPFSITSSYEFSNTIIYFNINFNLRFIIQDRLNLFVHNFWFNHFHTYHAKWAFSQWIQARSAIDVTK